MRARRMIDLLVMALAAGLLAPVAASAQEGPAARSAKERARDRKRAAKSLVILRDAWNEDGDDLGLRDRPVMLDCDWTYALIHGVGVANTLSEIGGPAGRRFLFAVVRHLYPDSHTTAIRPHRGPWRMAVARLQEDDDAESNEVLRGAARRLLALEEELRALWAFDAVALLGDVGELGDLERLDDLLAGEEPRVRVAAAAACLRILARG